VSELLEQTKKEEKRYGLKIMEKFRSTCSFDELLRALFCCDELLRALFCAVFSAFRGPLCYADCVGVDKLWKTL
jgi:hypothetical protein